MAKINILVIGSGGREHSLVWKIAQNPEVKKIYCSPGNAGIANLAECVAIQHDSIEQRISRLADFSEKHNIGLTVVGPELLLCNGITDVFNYRGMNIFGPTKAASEIEASKAFAKVFMRKYGIPTGEFGVTTDAGEARQIAEDFHRLYGWAVVKADGLCAGKGVIVCHTPEEAYTAIDRMLVKKEFGEAGNKIIIEELLSGQEVSFIALTDGRRITALPTSQDHKQALDRDKGENTGGMGAYSPAIFKHLDTYSKIMDKVMYPAIEAMKSEGREYKGVLYAGLMVKDKDIKVLEFNARFGDPETQPLMMRLNEDIVDLMMQCTQGRLDDRPVAKWAEPAVCVVMASGGYPGKYETGKTITGLDEHGQVPGAIVFHAGTARENNEWKTSGGRVLGVTAIGGSIQSAIDKCYDACSRISWEGAHYRKDIGMKAINHII